MGLRKLIVRIIDHKATPYVVAGAVIAVMLLPHRLDHDHLPEDAQGGIRHPADLLADQVDLGGVQGGVDQHPGPDVRAQLDHLRHVHGRLCPGRRDPVRLRLSKYPYRGSNFILISFLVTRILPPLALLLPFYMIFRCLG